MKKPNMSDWRLRLKRARDKVDAFATGAGARYNAHRDSPLLLVLALLVWALLSAGVWAIVLQEPATLQRYGTAVGVTLLLLKVALTFARGTLKRARAEERAEFDNRRFIDESTLPMEIQERLLDDEKVMYVCRTHPYRIFASLDGYAVTGDIMSGLGLVFLHLGDIGLGLALFFGGMIPITIKIWDWYRNEFVFTNQRMLRIYGIWSHHVSIVPRERLITLQFDTPFIARLLAWFRIIKRPWGSVTPETAADVEAIKQMKMLAKALLVELLIQKGAAEGIEKRAKEESSQADGT